MKHKKQQKTPIETAHLFETLDKKLIKLLKSLTKEEWHSPTIAKLWTVKDIAAHLLDGNLRTLSISRDGHIGVQPEQINSYNDLLNFLNQLNHSWTDAAKRLSPKLITQLLEITGKEFCNHIKKIPPYKNAVFSVAWAGQDVSPNWFHVAREYTEKFLHQQQIRDAVGKESLLTKKLYYPFLATFMQALPYTYKNVAAENGTIVSVIVKGKAGAKWHIIKEDKGWLLIDKIKTAANAVVIMQPEDAWKLFSKGISPQEAFNKVAITGDIELGKIALQMIAVMA